jgi:hypothetical protein
MDSDVEAAMNLPADLTSQLLCPGIYYEVGLTALSY